MMNLQQKRNLLDVILIGGIILVAIGFLVQVVASAVHDLPLRYCFNQRSIAWSKSDRAAQAAKYGIWDWQDSQTQKDALKSKMGCGELGYGVITDFQKTLSAPMTSAQTFVPVTSLALKDGSTLTMSMLGTEVFLTLEPGATNEEIVMCTGVDTVNKQFLGCTRGLAFSGTSTAGVSANQKTHSSGSTVVISNVHYVYNNYLDKLTTSTQSVAGPVTFTYYPVVTSTTAVPQTGDQLANKYYVDNVGAGGFTANNVSGTLGLQAITSGVPNCPSGAACVGVNASSTASTNGGFLGFLAGTGKMFWDFASFISGAWTITGKWIFQNGLQTSTPTSTLDVVNKGYSDASVMYGNATGTAGMALNPGDALYISTTGTLFQTNSNVASSTFQFVGISQGTYASSSIVTFTPPGGINCAKSGLSAGYNYYLNGTNGQIDLTPGVATSSARIGRAISANCLALTSPKFIASGATVIGAVGTTFVTTGFYPAYVQIRAATDENAGVNGGSWGDDVGNTLFATSTVAAQVQGFLATTTRAWYIMRGANVIQAAGTVSQKTPTGFLLNEQGYVGSGNVTILWTAYSE